MYPPWIIKLVLAISFAVMPLQGIAQTVAALLCPPTMHQEQQAGDSHHHDGGVNAHSHNAGDADLNAPDDGTSAKGHADHSLCSIVVTGLPSSATSLPAREFAVLAATPDVVRYFTFLELPQRPPLV